MLPPLFLLRHGQTQANRDGVLQGQADSPLTPLGRAQAAAMGRTLAAALPVGVPVTLWVSPLGRVRHTLARVLPALSGRAVAIRYDARLKEVAFGDWSLKPIASVGSDMPAAWTARQADPWNERPPGGESYADLAVRVRDFLDDLAAENGPDGAQPGRAVAILAHGGTGRVVRGLLTGLSPAAIPTLPAPQDAILRLTGPDGGPATMGRALEERLPTGIEDIEPAAGDTPFPVGAPERVARIAPATLADIPALQAVERDAALRFQEAGDREVDPTQATDTATLEAAVRESRLHLIRDAGAPVAFALEDRADGLPTLAELSVARSAGGRGLGRALAGHVLARAKAAGAPRLLLTTFVDVPWNGPWYARLGFVPVPEAEVGPDLAALLRDQRTRYTAHRRQAMEFWL